MPKAQSDDAGQDWFFDDLPAFMFLTIIYSPLFPASLVMGAYAALVAWGRRDYVSVAAVGLYALISWVRHPFVGSVILFFGVILYYVQARRAPSRTEAVVALGAAATAAYMFLVPEDADWWRFLAAIRSWWEGGSSLPAAYIALALSLTAFMFSVGSEGEGRLRAYLRENPGAVPVVAFMALLVSAATSLAAGAESSANKLAEFAYYFLVGGVGLQLLTLRADERLSEGES